MVSDRRALSTKQTAKAMNDASPATPAAASADRSNEIAAIPERLAKLALEVAATCFESYAEAINADA